MHVKPLLKIEKMKKKLFKLTLMLLVANLANTT